MKSNEQGPQTAGMALPAIFVVLTGLAAASVFQAAPAQQLPPPYHSPSVMNAPRVIPRPEGATLKVPQGFRVDTFAEDFERPRFMLLGPSQEILLTDSVQQGSVYVLQDRNGDGRVDEKKKIIEGLDRPYGLAFWKDYLYVGEPSSLKRFKYDSRTMSVATPGEEVVSLEGQGTGHWTRTVLFDRKGEKMYLSVGSRSNVDVGEDHRRATILRLNPDGTGQEIFATGLRNVIGMRWYPGTDTIWAGVQERDGLGDDLVPDYFTSVKEGGFYGWPYCYIGPNVDPRNEGKAPSGLVQQTIVPDVILGSHVAVLDILFYTGNMFPAEYRGGAFLAQHGSWNRSMRVGYDLVFVPFKNAKPSGPVRQFLSGFMLAPDQKEVWGRPVGLLQMPDGSLLMSDDGGKKIWRIRYGS